MGRENPAKHLLRSTQIRVHEMETQQIVVGVDAEMSCVLLMVSYFPPGRMRDYRAFPHAIHRSDEGMQVVIAYPLPCFGVLKSSAYHHGENESPFSSSFSRRFSPHMIEDMRFDDAPRDENDTTSMTRWRQVLIRGRATGAPGISTRLHLVRDDNPAGSDGSAHPCKSGSCSRASPPDTADESEEARPREMARDGARWQHTRGYTDADLSARHYRQRRARRASVH